MDVELPVAESTTTEAPGVYQTLGEAVSTERAPTALTILYDPTCNLCERCCHWMLSQPSYVPLRFVPCTGNEAKEKYGDLPWLGSELIVVSDRGEVWAGPAAFLTCLWALVEWRPWAFRLAGPAFAPLAERFFLMLSNRRRAFSVLLGKNCRDGSCSLG
ncbi:MAG: thiol-disulfide oxidoreductase DCC family protein [Myxococcota bacterium]